MIKRERIWQLALVAASIQGGSAAQTSRVGQLTDVRGKVEVQRGRLDARELHRAFTGLQLRPGDVVIARQGSRVVSVLYANGARWELRADQSGDSKAQVVAGNSAEVRLIWWRTGTEPRLMGKLPGVPQISRIIKGSSGSAGVRLMGRGADTVALAGEDMRLLWKPFRGVERISLQVRVNGKIPESWNGQGATLLSPSETELTLPGRDIPAGSEVRVVAFGLRTGAPPVEQSWVVRTLDAVEQEAVDSLRRQAAEEARRGSSDLTARILLATAYSGYSRLDEANSILRECRLVLPDDLGLLCEQHRILSELVKDYPNKVEYADELKRCQVLHEKAKAGGHRCEELMEDESPKAK